MYALRLKSLARTEQVRSLSADVNQRNPLCVHRRAEAIQELVAVGPIRNQTGWMVELLSDPAVTALNVVTSPEEMPVNETIEFERALRRDLDMGVDAIVVNAVHPARFRREELKRVRAVSGERPVTQAALSAAISEHLRARGEHAQVRRLRRAARAPVATLPRIFEPELGREHIERLSAELERRL